MMVYVSVHCAAQTLRWPGTAISSWRKRASPVWTENIFPRAQNENKILGHTGNIS